MRNLGFGTWVRRLAPVALGAVIAAGTLTMGAAPASANRRGHNGSEDAWRIATYGLGAATAYMAATKRTGPTIIGAVGTYLAYRKWDDAKDDRHDHWRGHGGWDRDDHRGHGGWDRDDHRGRGDRDDRWDRNDGRRDGHDGGRDGRRGAHHR